MIHHSEQSGMLKPIRCECGKVHHVEMEFILGQTALMCTCGTFLMSEPSIVENNVVGYWLVITPLPQTDTERDLLLQSYESTHPDCWN